MAATVLLSACGHSGGTPAHVSTSGPVAKGDVATLNGLLDLEHETIAAYEAGIPLLDQGNAKAATQFLRHELSHAGELSGLVKQAGGEPLKPRGDYNLGHPHDQDGVLALLHRLEQGQLAAYLHALAGLAAGTERAALAAIFANDAQHIAVLRARLHRSPAPSAFVSARE